MILNLKVNNAFKILYTKELENFREVIFYGGRGGAKTYELIQFLSIKALKEKCNILCLREFSNKNRNSLLSGFRDFFATYEVENILKDYNITSGKENAIKISINEISFKHNQSRVLFAGVNDNTIMGLKSITNIKYCWIDEANFLSEFSYNILKPTIRANDSKLFFTFNPQNAEDFLYQKTRQKNPKCYVKKVNWSDNPYFPKVLNDDRLNDLQTMPKELYLHIWEGEPLSYNDAKVINTDLIGFFNDLDNITYDEVFITADTAYSKKENADFSVIACFGVLNNEIHLLRIYKGRWDFNELINILLSAYEWLSGYKTPSNVIIEKKASGISLLQELQRLTNLPIREVLPKSDKFSRVSDILSELPRLKLPLSKSPLNSWTEDFLRECKAFRSDLKHAHDDQVDALCYALQYCKKKGVNWDAFASML